MPTLRAKPKLFVQVSEAQLKQFADPRPKDEQPKKPADDDEGEGESEYESDSDGWVTAATSKPIAHKKAPAEAADVEEEDGPALELEGNDGDDDDDGPALELEGNDGEELGLELEENDGRVVELDSDGEEGPALELEGNEGSGTVV